MSPRIGGASARFVCWHYTTYCFSGTCFHGRSMLQITRTACPFFLTQKRCGELSITCFIFGLLVAKRSKEKMWTRSQQIMSGGVRSFDHRPLIAHHLQAAHFPHILHKSKSRNGVQATNHNYFVTRI